MHCMHITITIEYHTYILSVWHHAISDVMTWSSCDYYGLVFRIFYQDCTKFKAYLPPFNSVPWRSRLWELTLVLISWTREYKVFNTPIIHLYIICFQVFLMDNNSLFVSPPVISSRQPLIKIAYYLSIVYLFTALSYMTITTCTRTCNTQRTINRLFNIIQIC